MAYCVAADFRPSTVQEYSHDCALTTTEVATDALLTAAIARISASFDAWTNDKFESGAATVRTLKGTSGGRRLYLPHRYTAVSQVRVADEDGTWTVQGTSGVYRLRSSLNATGTERVGSLDYLEILPSGDGLTGYPTWGSPYSWPMDANSVEVTGTIGWTVTPGDVKRAVALLVYHHFKPIAADLRMATRVTTADRVTDFALTEPSGVPDADRIIALYTRELATVGG